MRNMTARAEARAQGQKTYETGTPCKQGHVSPRATLTGTCVACTAAAAKQWRVQHTEKSAGYSAAYRQRNAEKVRELDRAYHALLREQFPERHREVSKRAYRRKRAAAGETVRDYGKVSAEELRQRLLGVHAGNYAYVGGYVNMNTRALFRCTKHALEIEAQPNNLLKGATPCPKCGVAKSKAEADIAAYLETFTEAMPRDRTILRPKELDIVLPAHKLAIEYSGVYWHSHFSEEAEREGRHDHYSKYTACADLGIRLLTIFESEWQERPHAIRRLLRNAIGKGRGKLMARKCELQKVSQQDAVAFFERYHPQGGPGYGEHYGLYWLGKLVACMRFTFGGNDRGPGAQNRTWTLSRFATRVTVAGGASRLFKAFVQEHMPVEVKSFSDNRYFSGGMYEKLGFVLDSESAPDYQVWSPKLGLRPKAHYQRRQLQKRLADHGMDDVFDAAEDPRTETEMTYLMGCGRIYDCGKKKWVWKPLDSPSPIV